MNDPSHPPGSEIMFSHSIGETFASIVQTWKPNKRLGARFLAIGCTAQYTAERVGVAWRTVMTWQTEDDFDRYVSAMRDAAVRAIEPEIAGNVRLALEVQASALRGEIPANGARVSMAERLIYRFVDRLLYVEPVAGSPHSYAPPGVSVTVQTGGTDGSPRGEQPRSGRIIPGELADPDPTADPPSD